MYMDGRIGILFLRTSMYVCLFVLIILTSCTGNTPLLSTPSTMSLLPTETFFATLPEANTATPTCMNGLTFISDLTIADNTIVPPGSLVEKQWLVQNSGTCNWDGRYRLRLINENALGAAPEQTLFPARAGSQATIQINFTAPLDAGSYTSEWQAFDMTGLPFGDSFFIKIIVQP